MEESSGGEGREWGGGQPQQQRGKGKRRVVDAGRATPPEPEGETHFENLVFSEVIGAVAQEARVVTSRFFRTTLACPALDCSEVQHVSPDI